MGWSLAVGSSQTTNEGANQSTVTVDTYLSWSGGASFYGITHTGRVNIGGVDYYYSTPSSVNYPNPTSSGTIRVDTTSRVIDHDVNGERGAITTWADLSGSVTGYLSASGPTQAALNYYRGPSQPSSLTATLNADKTITVTFPAVSSPAGTPTYYVAFSQDGGPYQNQQSGTGTSFTFSNLQAGANFVFRVYAVNSDGTSGTTYSSSVFVPPGFWVKTAGGVIPAKSVQVKTAGGLVTVKSIQVLTANGLINAK